MHMIDFRGAADYDQLPEGYFRVFNRGGAEIGLGFRQGDSYSLDVPASVDRKSLPCVLLNLPC